MQVSSKDDAPVASDAQGVLELDAHVQRDHVRRDHVHTAIVAPHVNANAGIRAHPLANDPSALDANLGAAPDRDARAQEEPQHTSAHRDGVGDGPEI
jgi:hypothetical protein